MAKDSRISIRVDIARDKAISLSLSLKPHAGVANELLSAKQERLSGYVGRTSDEVVDEMERIISEIERGKRNC